jgi:hypothetical protein
MSPISAPSCSIRDSASRVWRYREIYGLAGGVPAAILYHGELRWGLGHRNDPQSIAEALGEIDLADRLGLDVFGIGEHHRPEFLASAPAVLLAAAAARMTSIRLVSVVGVLSSDDPIRLFQQFATLDLISGGRGRDYRRPRLRTSLHFAWEKRSLGPCWCPSLIEYVLCRNL